MPLGVYVHFPYCRSLCPYCDFNSHVAKRIPHEEYATAVLTEMAARSAEVAGRTAATVYFGGGTPGLWEPRALGRVIETIDRTLGIDAGAEVSAEVNPGSIDDASLLGLRSAGVNRLSIGVQALSGDELRFLGRGHSVADALRTVERARRKTFHSVSIDLIFGLPEQTIAGWTADLRRAASLGPDHISAYELTVEDGTPLAGWVASGRVHLAAEDVRTDLLLATQDTLADAGYEAYEVSNYARPGHRSQHNLLYWTGGEYLGLGAGAHGFHYQGEAAGVRYADVDDPAEYMARAAEPPEGFREQLTADDLAREALLTGLRITDGIDVGAVHARTGIDLLSTRAERISRLAGEGLVEQRGHRLAATGRGRLVLNAVVAYLA